MKIYNFKQNTPEWYQIRKMKFTASNANTILAQGKGLKTLIKKMLTEHYSSGNYEEYLNKFQNDHMKRGKEFEDKARAIYELETGNEVIEVGFVERNEHIGCSPDGLVGKDGLIEIKNFCDDRFFDLMITGRIEKKYLDQMDMQMYVTEREWCDFFVFNPNFEKKPFFLTRIKRDEEKMQIIENALNNAVEKLLSEQERIEKLIVA